MVLRTCQQIEGGLPADVQAKMMFNIALDFGIGLVPFLGDIADALFRANTRNAVELERHLRAKGAKALKAQGQSVPAVDPSDPLVYDRTLEEEHGPPPGYTSGTAGQHGTAQGSHSAQSNTTPAAGGGVGWFSGFRSKKSPSDPEHGEVRRGEVGTSPAAPGRQPVAGKSTLQKTRI